MSRKIEFYIVDIFIASNKITRYTAHFDNAKAFLYSELEWDAVIRELEIIGEATNKLLQTGLIDDTYRMIVDFRNQIAHGYFGIDEEIVWEVVSSHLHEFLHSLETVVKQKKLCLDEAITCSKEDHHYNSHILSYLSDLQQQFS